MAKKADLMGLGLPMNLARRMSTEPLVITSGGTSVGSAVQIAQDQYFTVITASTASNNSVVLPQVGGDGPASGALLGDDFIINNQAGTSCIVFVANNAAGSAVSISQGGAITAGTTGISVSVHKSGTFYPITASTWACITA
jgi:hypothetical protein